MGAPIIPQGELKEIAQLVEDERIIIKGGPLRMGHSRQEVVNGNAPEYPAGLGGTVKTGRDGPVWCLATESDVTLEIDPEGFAIVDTFRSFLGIDSDQSIGLQKTQTEREIAATRMDDIEFGSKGTNLAAGAEEGHTLYTNNSGGVKVLEGAFLNRYDTYSNDMTINVYIYDADNNLRFNPAINPEGFPVMFDPGLPLEDGARVEYQIRDEAGSSSTIQMTVLIMTPQV